jgi:hypothetical protein
VFLFLTITKTCNTQKAIGIMQPFYSMDIVFYNGAMKIRKADKSFLCHNSYVNEIKKAEEAIKEPKLYWVIFGEHF